MSTLRALTFLLCLGLSLPAPALRLIDVPPEHPDREMAYQAVERYHLLEPWPDQTFRGPLPLTRYELAQSTFTALRYLSQQVGLALPPPIPVWEGLFQDQGGDLARRHWAAQAIQELSRYNLLLSDPERFQGELKVSRYALAVQLQRLLRTFEAPPSQPASLWSRGICDLPDQHWARQAVETSLELNLLSLDNQGCFRGEQPANHYDLARGLVSVLHRLEKQSERAVRQPPAKPEASTAPPQIRHTRAGRRR